MRSYRILEEEEEPSLIYTAQGSPIRCKKLSVINESPEHNNVKNYPIHISITLILMIKYMRNYVQIKDLKVMQTQNIFTIQ